MKSATMLLIGVIIGFTAGTLVGMADNKLDEKLIDDCRRQVYGFEALSSDAKKSFMDGVNSSKEAKLRWAIVNAVSKVPGTATDDYYGL